MDHADTLAARGSTPELAIVLETISTLYLRSKATAPEWVLTRLARIAARSLLWEPHPAMLCAWSIETAGQYELLREWLGSADADLGAFATWVAKKISANVRPAPMLDALRRFLSRWSGAAASGSPRLQPAIGRAQEILAGGSGGR